MLLLSIRQAWEMLCHEMVALCDIVGLRSIKQMCLLEGSKDMDLSLGLQMSSIRYMLQLDSGEAK
jgi:hypothetical protein